MSEIEIETEYKKRLPFYERLKDEVINIIEHLLKENGIPYHLIEGRIKTLNSFHAKSQKLGVDQPFDAISDICGLRVICLFLSDQIRIGEIIEQVFELLSKDDKYSQKPMDQFGYFSVHYIARLPRHYTGFRYDDLKDLTFEIQVRTIATHAWATVSHYLDYKSPQVIPDHLKRDFTALSALFYLADNHFELFFKNSNEARKSEKRQIANAQTLDNLEINIETILAYFKQVYPDRKTPVINTTVELIEELIDFGYKTIGDLKIDVERGSKAFAQYEEEEQGKIYFNCAGALRGSLYIANQRYLEFMAKRRKLEENFLSTFREFHKS